MKSHICIVSASEEILRLLSEALKSDKWEVSAFSQATKAFNALKDKPSQIIIADQDSGGMTGINFLLKVRSLSTSPIRILLMNSPDIDMAAKVVNDGIARKLLSVPWNQDELLNIIQNALLLASQIKVDPSPQNADVKEQEELQKWDDLLKDSIKSRTRIILQKKTSLEKLNRELEENIFETIKALFSYLEKKNRWIGTHSKKVAAFSVELATEMNLPAKAIQKVEIAALLHDIGKIGIPEKIISKSPHLLSKIQLEQLKGHPVLGQKIISPVFTLADVGKIIRHHHEQWKGSGYPNGLKEDEIPIGSRIIAVANLFNNLQEKVFHRTNDPIIRSLREIVSRSGTELDPDIVDAFLKMIDTKRQETSKRRQETKISQGDLKEGMMISRDIMTTRGTTVLNRGTIISNSHLDFISEFDRMEKVFDEIFIYVDVQEQGVETGKEEEEWEEDEF